MRETHKGRVVKDVPSLWWDFHWTGNRITDILVESTHPDCKVVKKIPLPEDRYDAAPEIEQAEALIKDLREGRLSFKQFIQKENHA